MTNKEIADLLLPGINVTPEEIEARYANRNLKEGALVTRFAPSPTGFVHMGSLYGSLIDWIYAKQTDGVVYLRIEDTDGERTVENGIENIVRDLKTFDIEFMEGPSQGGEYGPYIQSERKEIYQCFAKKLIEEGKAYPCFCTKDDLDSMRESQEKSGSRTGYYGMYAKCRNLSNDDIEERVKRGDKYVIRMRSMGSFRNKVNASDVVRGKLNFPENDYDEVIIKGDGLPTYHFAHICDDHLMKTTLVVRGEEWLPSLPKHVQMFDMMGWEKPKYLHTSAIGKVDEETGGKRKLSKRKDPESAVSYYHEHGIPHEVVKLYLAALINTNFEEWYTKEREAKLADFKFDFKKMSTSIAMFDLDKLMNISKIYFSRMKAEDVYNETLTYCNEFDKEFAELLTKYKEKSIALLNIERECKKPRKDIGSYPDVRDVNWYMFKELFDTKKDEELYADIDKERTYDKDVLKMYAEEIFDENADKDAWFEGMKTLAEKNGYSPDTKAYKENPDAFKGHVGDVCEQVRFAVTSKTKTPDLYELLRILGKEEVQNRINRFVNYMK